MVSSGAEGARIVGRYALCDEIAHGGMATVHVGRLVGTAGFARTVAIKRLHAQYAKDPDFVSMFVDEARLAARIHHPNVVSTLDVVARDGELFLVMEYVRGESLARLEKLASDRGDQIGEAFIVSIVAGLLHGLHAAHEARGERGEPLGIVHRDVSPQNVLVGSDGVSRVLDFGIAKAAVRIQTTRDGQLKGKLPYMAPEQLRGEVSRVTDVYAAGVVLWEGLTGKRLFAGDNEGVVVTRVMKGCSEPPSAYDPRISAEVDAITLRALRRDPSQRFQTAREMARALEDAVGAVPTSKIGDWVAELAATSLLEREKRVEAIESRSATETPAAAPRDSALGVDVMPRAAVEGPRPALEEPLLTQLTTGVTADPAPVSRARRKPAVALLLLTGLLVMAGVGASFYRGQATADAASGARAPEISVAPAADSVGSVIVRAVSLPAAADAGESEAPTPSALSGASIHRALPRAPSAPQSKKGRHCDPPYTIDQQGVRTFKKECL